MDASIKFAFPVALLIIAAALIFMGIDGDVEWGERSFKIRSEWGRIVSFLIGCSLVSIAVWLELRKFRSGRMPNKRQGETTLRQFQAKDFFTTVNERSEAIETLVKNATKIKISGITAVNLLSQHQRVFEDLLRHGCTIQLMFLNPHSEAAKIVYGGKYERYRSNVQSTQDVLRQLTEIAPEKIKIKLMEHAPTVSMIFVYKQKLRVINQSFVQVQLYFLRGAIGADRPIFRVSSRDKWYKIFKREFKELWDGSPDWTSK